MLQLVCCNYCNMYAATTAICMLQLVCCNILQHIAVCLMAHCMHGHGCCSVLQCVAVCHSVSQCVAVCCSVLQCVRRIVCMGTGLAMQHAPPTATYCCSKHVITDLLHGHVHCYFVPPPPPSSKDGCNILQHAATYCNMSERRIV